MLVNAVLRLQAIKKQAKENWLIPPKKHGIRALDATISSSQTALSYDNIYTIHWWARVGTCIYAVKPGRWTWCSCLGNGSGTVCCFLQRNELLTQRQQLKQTNVFLGELGTNQNRWVVQVFESNDQIAWF
jgi:hypothetical protein